MGAQIRNGYTSTGESGSEAEDITSPKASGNSMNPILTPVKEEASDYTLITTYRKAKMSQQININVFMFIQAKFVDKAGHGGSFSEYDECVPMVDKTVDVGLKEKQTTSVTPQNSFGSKG